MKERCGDFWEGIVDLAEGRESKETAAHLAHCTACEAKMNELQSIFLNGDLRFYDAPAGLIANVKAMMQPKERKMASLVRSTLSFSGARAVAEDFQLIVGDDETQTRLMFARSGSGWEVMGRLPSEEWIITRDGSDVESEEDGRFSFYASKLSDTSFKLTHDGTELVVPSAEELLSDGSDGPN